MVSTRNGILYEPEENGHIMIPRAVFRAVDFWTHTDPYGGNRNVVRHIRLEEVEHNPESA